MAMRKDDFGSHGFQSLISAQADKMSACGDKTRARVWRAGREVFWPDSEKREAAVWEGFRFSASMHAYGSESWADGSWSKGPWHRCYLPWFAGGDPDVKKQGKPNTGQQVPLAGVGSPTRRKRVGPTVVMALQGIDGRPGRWVMAAVVGGVWPRLGCGRCDPMENLLKRMAG